MGSNSSSSRERERRRTRRDRSTVRLRESLLMLDPDDMCSSQAWDKSEVDRLVKSGRIAPSFPPEEEEQSDLEKCPICFLYFPALNWTKCCKHGICTECYLRVHPPQSSYRRSKCPFCKFRNFVVSYSGKRSKKEREEEEREKRKVEELETKARIEREKEDEKRRGEGERGFDPSEYGISAQDSAAIANVASHPPPSDDNDLYEVRRMDGLLNASRYRRRRERLRRHIPVEFLERSADSEANEEAMLQRAIELSIAEEEERAYRYRNEEEVLTLNSTRNYSVGTTTSSSVEEEAFIGDLRLLFHPSSVSNVVEADESDVSVVNNVRERNGNNDENDVESDIYGDELENGMRLLFHESTESVNDEEDLDEEIFGCLFNEEEEQQRTEIVDVRNLTEEEQMELAIRLSLSP